MELVFETDREPMKESNRLLVCGEVRVKLLSSLDGSIEEDLVEAVYL